VGCPDAYLDLEVEVLNQGRNIPSQNDIQMSHSTTGTSYFEGLMQVELSGRPPDCDIGKQWSTVADTVCVCTGKLSLTLFEAVINQRNRKKTSIKQSHQFTIYLGYMTLRPYLRS